MDDKVLGGVLKTSRPGPAHVGDFPCPLLRAVLYEALVLESSRLT